MLAGAAEGLSAGGEDAQVRASPKKRREKLVAPVDQVLAVVKDHQYPTLGEEIHEGVEGVLMSGAAKSESLRDGAHQQRGSFQRGQFHEPHAVRKRVPGAVCGAKG
ncbi:hypothetical protein GCM10009712_37610 [Pseudarthrobacter sulfonivorans]